MGGQLCELYPVVLFGNYCVNFARPPSIASGVCRRVLEAYHCNAMSRRWLLLQKLKVQITLNTMIHGIKQTSVHLTDGVYCKGTQRMILQPFSHHNIWVMATWDGVDYDRYVVRLYRQISGDECALYQGRKV